VRPAVLQLGRISHNEGMNKLFGLFLILSGAVCAQPFGLGIKVGVPFTDAVSLVPDVSPDSFANNNHYLVGPYGEIRLPGGFSVEVDALYRSFNYALRGEPGSNGNWEFPVMAKYKVLKKGPVKPYIEGGLVLSHLTGSDLNITHASNYGVTLGAGLEIHAFVLRISPEIRYDGFFFHDFSSNTFVQSNRNQAMVLVGIGF
jgi:outer membrane protein with beta-barrel domain